MKSRVPAVLCCLVFAFVALSADYVDARASGSSSGGRSSSSSRSSSSTSRPSSSGSTSKSPGGYGNTASSPSGKPAGSTSGYGNTGTAATPKPSSPAGGYGNTATKNTAPAGTPSSPKPQGSSGGYGNSAAGAAGVAAGVAAGAAASGSQASQTSQPPKTQVQQKMERSFSKKESAKALDTFKRDQTRYKQDPGAKSYTPSSATERSTVDSIRKRVTYTESSTYYTRRNVFYTSYGWSAPGYIYGSYSSFGIWDAMMLWFMLDHLNDHRYSSMYYHHRDDPGMQQFRKEAERLSLENADLREKLKDLDTRTKAMEAQGVKPDPSYVPEDAANVALASSVVEKEMSHGSFPWGWTVAGALAIVLVVMMMRRRKV